eukprot:90296-Heterocapsa_arctica.AAC.1
MSSSGHSWWWLWLGVTGGCSVLLFWEDPSELDPRIVVLVASQLRPAARWVRGSLCGPEGLRRMRPSLYPGIFLAFWRTRSVP